MTQQEALKQLEDNTPCLQNKQEIKGVIRIITTAARRKGDSDDFEPIVYVNPKIEGYSVDMLLSDFLKVIS